MPRRVQTTGFRSRYNTCLVQRPGRPDRRGALMVAAVVVRSAMKLAAREQDGRMRAGFALDARAQEIGVAMSAVVEDHVSVTGDFKLGVIAITRVRLKFAAVDRDRSVESRGRLAVAKLVVRGLNVVVVADQVEARRLGLGLTVVTLALLRSLIGTLTGALLGAVIGLRKA
jgi:hypothetical protein